MFDRTGINVDVGISIPGELRLLDGNPFSLNVFRPAIGEKSFSFPGMAVEIALKILHETMEPMQVSPF